MLKIGKKRLSLNMEKNSGRELQFTRFTRKIRLCHHLDHTQKPILTSFGDGLPNRIGAAQVATISGTNAKQPPMSIAQVDFYRNIKF